MYAESYDEKVRRWVSRDVHIVLEALAMGHELRQTSAWTASIKTHDGLISP